MADNEVSIFNQDQLPAHLQGGVEDPTAESMITSGESIPKISIKGFQFTLRTKDEDKKLAGIGVAIRVVILAIDPPNKHVAKSFFKGKYTGENENPDCSSSNGVVPDSWVEQPQHTACASCPKNVYGAAKNEKGKDIKACSDHKRIIVVPIDDLDADVAAIQIPAMSLKSLSKYGRQLLKHRAPLTGMITELSFDEEAEYPRLVFTASGFLPEEDYNKAAARASSEELQDLLHAEPSSVPAQAVGGAAELGVSTGKSIDFASLPKTIDAGLEDRLEKEAPAKKLVLTAKAGKHTLEKFLAPGTGWTEKKLIDGGYAEYK